MRLSKFITINAFPSCGGRKAALASVLLHGFIFLLFFATSISKTVISPQIMSVTLHQLQDVQVRTPASAGVKIQHGRKIDEIKSRYVPDHHAGVADNGRSIPVVEKKFAMIQQPSVPEDRLEKDKIERAVAVIPETPDHSPAMSSLNGSAKTEGSRKISTEQIADARFGQRGAPSFIHQAVPVYPAIARRLGKEGRVLLKLLIDADGKLKNIEVIEAAGYGFTEASLEAVKKSTYAPGFQNGEKIAMRVLLPISFRLQ